MDVWDSPSALVMNESSQLGVGYFCLEKSGQDTVNAAVLGSVLWVKDVWKWEGKEAHRRPGNTMSEAAWVNSVCDILLWYKMPWSPGEFVTEFSVFSFFQEPHQQYSSCYPWGLSITISTLQTGKQRKSSLTNLCRAGPYLGFDGLGASASL